MNKWLRKNEKGAGGIAETLIITLFAVLITGAVALLIYNAISDKGNAVTQGIRGTGGSAPSDLDGDGALNGLVLVGQANDIPKTKYWRGTNQITDFGMPNATIENATNGAGGNNDDGDVGDNVAETASLVTTDTQDMYYKKLGASMKDNTGRDPQNPNK